MRSGTYSHHVLDFKIVGRGYCQQASKKIYPIIDSIYLRLGLPYKDKHSGTKENGCLFQSSSYYDLTFYRIRIDREISLLGRRDATDFKLGRTDRPLHRRDYHIAIADNSIRHSSEKNLHLESFRRP